MGIFAYLNKNQHKTIYKQKKMRFGQIKTIIEQNFINSYTDKQLFAETVRGFKSNFLCNKDLAKIYLLYDELSSPKNLSKEDAKDFLEEGIAQLKNLISRVQLPKENIDIKSEYMDIDNILYKESVDIKETIESKKNIMSVLMSKPKILEAKANIPISSVIKIANKTINEYVDTLDEDVKNDLLWLMNENEDTLKETFETEKTIIVEKLNNLIQEDKGNENLETLNATIDKVKNEEFDKMNLYRLRKLRETLE